MLISIVSLILSTTATVVLAHGAAPHRDEGEDLDWASRHMLVEHHLNEFTPSAFFSLHDFDHTTTWTDREILRTYGVNPDTNHLVDDTGDESREILKDKRDEIVQGVLRLMDYDNDGAVSLEEFEHFWNEGGRLPDYGLGTGHHGDDEYEYEIHHYEKYHDENTREEDLTHPEDIAHFRKHDQLHHEEEIMEEREKQSIVEENIPVKFRIQR